MRHFSYLAVLAGCLVVTAPLELLLGTRVYARPRRLARALLPVLVLFVGWDLYAISAGHWDFDARSTTGVVLPGGLPLDELLFFLVVPVCSILALEAVRSVTGWRAGDEAAPRGPAPAGDLPAVPGQPPAPPARPAGRGRRP